MIPIKKHAQILHIISWSGWFTKTNCAWNNKHKLQYLDKDLPNKSIQLFKKNGALPEGGLTTTMRCVLYLQPFQRILDSWSTAGVSSSIAQGDKIQNMLKVAVAEPTGWIFVEDTKATLLKRNFF